MISISQHLQVQAERLPERHGGVGQPAGRTGRLRRRLRLRRPPRPPRRAAAGCCSVRCVWQICIDQRRSTQCKVNGYQVAAVYQHSTASCLSWMIAKLLTMVHSQTSSDALNRRRRGDGVGRAQLRGVGGGSRPVRPGHRVRHARCARLHLRNGAAFTKHLRCCRQVVCLAGRQVQQHCERKQRLPSNMSPVITL